MAPQTGLATILPPSRRINGLTQAQLADTWWKTIYSIPAKNHFGLFDDATDPRGRRGSTEKAWVAEQNDSLLFIGGGFGEITTKPGSDGTMRIKRTIVGPSEGRRTLFLPILNASFDNLVNDPNDSNNLTGDLTVAELQTALGGFMSRTAQGGMVSDLFASVDGRRLSAPLGYRQASKAGFHLHRSFSR